MARYRTPTREDWIVTASCVGAATALVAGGALLLTPRHPVVFFFLAAGVIVALVRWHAGKFAYRCRHCGAEFEISPLKDLIGPHMWTEKYVRCPKCHTFGWAAMLTKSSQE